MFSDLFYLYSKKFSSIPLASIPTKKVSDTSFAQISDEIIIEIFRLLPYYDLSQMALVSKKWYKLSQSPQLNLKRFICVSKSMLSLIFTHKHSIKIKEKDIQLGNQYVFNFQGAENFLCKQFEPKVDQQIDIILTEVILKKQRKWSILLCLTPDTYFIDRLSFTIKNENLNRENRVFIHHTIHSINLMLSLYFKTANSKINFSVPNENIFDNQLFESEISFLQKYD